MINNFFVFFIIFSFALIFFCKKYNILVDQKIEKHKKYSTKSKSFLIGGVLFVIFKLLLFKSKTRSITL